MSLIPGLVDDVFLFEVLPKLSTVDIVRLRECSRPLHTAVHSKATTICTSCTKTASTFFGLTDLTLKLNKEADIDLRILSNLERLKVINGGCKEMYVQAPNTVRDIQLIGLVRVQNIRSLMSLRNLGFHTASSQLEELRSPHLTSLTCDCSREEQYRGWSNLTSLSTLSLTRLKAVTGGSLSVLTNLTSLSFYKCPMIVVEELQSMTQLVSLATDEWLTPEDLAPFSCLTRLETTGFVGAEALRQAKSLRYLDLINNKHVKILSPLPHITQLRIGRNTQLFDDDLVSLPNLQSLSILNECEITEAGILNLSALTDLSLLGTSDFTDRCIARLTQLTSLCLVRVPNITNAAIKLLTNLASLDSRANTQITEEVGSYLPKLVYFRCS